MDRTSVRGAVGSAESMARNAPRAARDDPDVPPGVRPPFDAWTSGTGIDEARAPRRAALVFRGNRQRPRRARQRIRTGVDAVAPGPRRRRTRPGVLGVD